MFSFVLLLLKWILISVPIIFCSCLIACFGYSAGQAFKGNQFYQEDPEQLVANNRWSFINIMWWFMYEIFQSTVLWSETITCKQVPENKYIIMCNDYFSLDQDICIWSFFLYISIHTCSLFSRFVLCDNTWMFIAHS